MTLASAASASRGAIWHVIWSQRAFGLQPGLLALIAVGAIAIFVVALRRYRRHGSAHHAGADSPDRKQASRIFNVLNVAQSIAILVDGFVLAYVGLKDFTGAGIILRASAIRPLAWSSAS